MKISQPVLLKTPVINSAFRVIDRRLRRFNFCAILNWIVLWVGGLWAVALVTITVSTGQITLNQVPEIRGSPSNANLRCGIDSLYLLLRLQGLQIALQDVEKQVVIGPHGATLAEIERSGRALGARLRIFRVQPASIARLSLPVIAHLESTDESPEPHYVVLLRVTENRVTFIEPTSNSLQDLDRQTFLRRASGFYLGQQPSWQLAHSKNWIFLGIMVVLVGIFLRVFSTTGKRSRKWSQLITALFPLIICCGCSKQSVTPHPATPAVLEFERTHVSLGEIPWRGTVKATFPVRCNSDRPVTIEFGVPTCACSGVSMEPDGPLKPGESRLIVLTFDPGEGRNGGVVSADVILTVLGNNGTYTLSASGRVQGALPTLPFVLRPHNIAENKWPDLKLRFVTTRSDSTIELLSITCQNKSFDRKPSQETLPVCAHIERSKFGEADKIVHGGEAFVRAVEIPISFQALDQSMQGEFAVDYSIDGEVRRTKVDLLVIAE